MAKDHAIVYNDDDLHRAGTDILSTSCPSSDVFQLGMGGETGRLADTIETDETDERSA